MSRWKRWAEIVILFVGVPLAVLFWAQIAIAVGVKSLVLFSGSLVAAWMFSAVALPMLFGALSIRELVESYQSRVREARFYEGVRLGGARDGFLLRLERLWSGRRREKFYPLEPNGGPLQGQGFPFWKGRFTFD